LVYRWELGAQIISGKSTHPLNTKLHQIDSDEQTTSDRQTRCNIDKVLSRLDQIETVND